MIEYRCGYRNKCPHYIRYTSRNRNAICHASTAQILRENRCERVNERMSELEKKFRTLEDVGIKFKDIKELLRSYLPEKE